VNENLDMIGTSFAQIDAIALLLDYISGSE
jgi:hypothetical protein